MVLASFYLPGASPGGLPLFRRRAQQLPQGGSRELRLRASSSGIALESTDTESASFSSSERESWAASVRGLTGRRKHRLWEPQLLDPPPTLADVSVVLLSPKRPNSVGSVARAASSFECEDIRIIAPRCNHLARSARNGSKGAQYLLWRAQLFDGLEEAAANAAVTVAFTRWVQGRSRAFRSPAELFAAPTLQHLFRGPTSLEPGSAAPTKVVFVFGREESGLTEAEIDSCDYVCSIPIGRLQESLSLSHAVSIVLSQLFQLRLAHSGVVPATLDELAPGYPHSDSEDD